MQVEDIFEQFGALFAGAFGSHLAVTLELTDDEAARGVTREISIQRGIPCDKCDGRGSPDPAAIEACPACAGRGGHTQAQGMFIVQRTCERCHGRVRLFRDPCRPCKATGVQYEDATITVVVPPGAQHEQTITIAGAGTRMADGTIGDVYVHLVVGGRPDSRFAGTPEPELPVARLHGAKRPLPIVPIATIACVLITLAALAYAVR